MKYVQISMPRCLLVMTEQEMCSLLARDPELWQKALKRGKGVKRVESAAERIGKPLKDGGKL